MRILDILDNAVPNEKAENVREIDYERLRKLGYSTILFDYDNTIAVWREPFDMRNKPVIDSLISSGMKVGVVTNGPQSRVKNLKDLFGEDLKVYHSMRKPGTKELRKVLSEMKSRPEKTVIIGDLFFTDIIAGNRMGMYSILVSPLVDISHKWYKRLLGKVTIAAYLVFFFTVGWIFRTGRLATPHLFATTVMDIDFDSLKDSGYRLIIFDFDNTLEKWGATSVSKEKRLLISRVERLGLEVVLISNGKSSRLGKIERELGKTKVISRARKPFTFKAKRVLKDFGIPPYKTVIVGDQLFTDIIMGNLLGAYTVKVEPISDREFFWTKLVRRVEGLILSKMRKHPEVEALDR
ncbi:haloacid dehalogenase [Mesotoga sp. HF07.pep.5.2.highcov]|uniref:YqeG family HAD IIIA-type phosphatase n=1 Tax=unclassified Mesotoga TaxID=1184398 RepID=UPI000EF1577C|nr:MULTISPECIES: YqeG family HAD IIIA-type phosphatase [unclassified Mesotoga]MDK2944802.1 putative phosphatase [Mesotoga sp.]RLL87852.1 haloacid dehalogenase [Mesotoga sp. H07pep.5.4]RLL91896.1 haloacid dehalogenase [Mesotoga sp. HF07.pep.5.2.highcov]